MSRTVTFTVDGKPATAGSKRGIIRRNKGGKMFVAMKDDSGDKGIGWRALVQDRAKAAMGDGGQENPIRVPVAWLTETGFREVVTVDGDGVKAGLFDTGETGTVSRNGKRVRRASK